MSLEQEFQEILRTIYVGNLEVNDRFFILVRRISLRRLSQLGKSFCSLQDIEDLSQEICLSVNTKLHTYRHDLPFLNWLYAVIQYRYIDFYRKTKKQRLASNEAMNWYLSSDMLYIDFQKFLLTLTFKEKKLLSYYSNPCSISDLAQNLGMSYENTKTSIHRLSTRLKSNFDFIQA